MVFFCIHCNMLSSSQDEMKKHCASECHKFNTMTDEEKLWKYRVLAQCLCIATERVLNLTSKYENKLEIKFKDIEKTVEEVVAFSRSVSANPVGVVKENVQELSLVGVKNDQKDVSVGGNPTFQSESNPHCDGMPHQWIQYTSFGNLSCSSEDFASEADCVCGKPHKWKRLCTNLDALKSSSRESSERNCTCLKSGPSNARCCEPQLHLGNIRSSFSSEESIIPRTTSSASSLISDYLTSTIKLDSTASGSTTKNDRISLSDLQNEKDEISDWDCSSEGCSEDMCDEGHILESNIQSKEDNKFPTTIISEIRNSNFPQVHVTSKVCKKCNKQTIECKCLKRRFKKMLVNFFGKFSFWRS